MNEKLAIDGGTPVRSETLPYGRQAIDADDIAAVTEVLQSGWLTTGPKVAEFEEALAACCGTSHAVAVSNGTAALHAAMYAVGVGPGDEVIVPTMTFAATANGAAYRGAAPVFADVDPATLLIDPASVEAKLTQRTKAIIAVDYAGQPCDYAALRAIAESRGVVLLDDACHALGGRDADGRAVGSLGELNTFSFHPVKPITTGEGGAITTDSAAHAAAMRTFRNHGITTDFRQREQTGGWFYEMVDLGQNYRLSDLQCALGITQLAKLPGWVARRQQIARRYDEAFAGVDAMTTLTTRPGVEHAYHLFMIQLKLDALRVDRAAVFKALRAEGIGVNVHYIPVHLHPFYRERFGTGAGDCLVAEAAYERLITLPVYPTMTDDDADDVIRAVSKVLAAYRR